MLTPSAHPDPKQRFSSRVENYIKYRPSYPAAIITTLQNECGLTPACYVADIGSGTGILTRLFLDFGCPVLGIEPNPQMRAAGERLLAEYPRFASLDGSAEASGLPDEGVDFITVGQAFHWFDLPAARREFKRILRPGVLTGNAGWVVLVWNERRIDSTPFLQEYERLLHTYGTDYDQTKHRNFDETVIREFFAPSSVHLHIFDNAQWFDLEGVTGRVLSSSYVPQPGQPGYDDLMNGLRRAFDQYNLNGQVAFEYDTRMYFGRL